VNWLLLRGLAREQRHWGEFPAVLARTRAGDRVHCLDLVGAGTECERDVPLSVPAIAEDLRARWLPLRDAHPGAWGLFGVSLGGMIALAWCAAHDDDFARLVVANSSARDLAEPWQRMSVGVFAGLLRSMREKDPVSRERHVLTMTTRLLDGIDALATEWAGYAMERPMRRANAVRQILAAARFRSPPRVRTPVLVIAGGADRLADPACSKAIAAKYGAPIEIHPAAGHDIGTDAPEWTADRIAEWIDATGG
jgi:pimeloyl-ACP methyl ester carboxylesterase